MQILIRTAKINDTESITDLSNQLGYKTRNTDLRNRLKIVLTKSDHCVFAATENGIIVGWIHGFFAFRIESDFFVEIGGLVVDENFRKNGIGKKLVDKVIEWSTLKNCTKVRVRCNVIRKESHTFYEHIGFEVDKEQRIFSKLVT